MNVDIQVVIGWLGKMTKQAQEGAETADILQYLIKEVNSYMDKYNAGMVKSYGKEAKNEANTNAR